MGLYRRMRNNKSFEILGALGGAAMGMPNYMSFDKDVIGARGSAKDMGQSVDSAKGKKMGAAMDVATEQQAAAAAAAAESEKVFDLQKESQKKGQQRKGRRASILTSSQGASEPLGLLG